MHQRKSKRILTYLLLLTTVGSINNIYLNDFKFDLINTINISGLNEVENEILKQEIESSDLKSIFSLKENKIRSIIEKNTLIENYKIFKKYPSTLDIRVKETNLLAKINKNGKIYLIGSNGKLTLIDNGYSELPYIFGKPDIKEFLQFKKIIDKSKFSYNQIKNLYFFPSKRWDLKLNNNILLKLPNNLTQENLNNLYEFLGKYNEKHLKTVDARLENKIILNE